MQSTGGIVGTVNLAGDQNVIPVLGSLAVTSGTFNLVDNGNLQVLGNLTANGIAINDAGALTVSGGLVASSNVSLTAGSIAIDGLVSDSGVGTTNLIANNITETGALIAGTLSGSAADAADFTGATASANQIAALGNFSASSFTLRNGSNLAIGGTINSGAITLVNTGAISETGALITGALDGSAGGSANLTGANQIVTLGNFSAPSIALNDVANLTIGGAVTGSSNVTIVDAGALSVSGSIAAPVVNLTAGDIMIPGAITDGGAGAVSLIATAGNIDQTGTLIAGTLSGLAAGSANFSGPTTQVATLGDFSPAHSH